MNSDYKMHPPAGVIPACLLPFNADMTVDEESYRRHLADVAAVDGVTAVAVNGHASEVSSCSFDEQKRLLDISLDEVGDAMPLISGVFADGSIEAARLAKMAEQGGAKALLVFPPSLFNKGVQVRDAVALEHYRRIADATDLPIIIFQYAMAAQIGYRLDTLRKLIDEIPSICAMKDNSGDPVFHEMAVRELQGGERKFNVLTTHSGWLKQSLASGCAGILSGSGSVVADVQVALWRAVQNRDADEAERQAERLYYWTQCIYTKPAFDAHNRMKEALVLLGRQSHARVRPPLVPIERSEVEVIRNGLLKAGLLSASDGALAATG